MYQILNTNEICFRTSTKTEGKLNKFRTIYGTILNILKIKFERIQKLKPLSN